MSPRLTLRVHGAAPALGVTRQVGKRGVIMAQAINDGLIRGNDTANAPGMPLVLMYHSVEPYQADPYLVTVSPPRFGEQMRWLARRGLRGVSMRDLLAARAAGGGKGLVGLTFDDGYADFARHALPVLRRYGFGATMFVIAGRLGGENAWDQEGPRKRLMDAPEVWALAQAGIEIGSHGLRHVRLPAAGDALAEEIGGSRRILQETTGKPVSGFCYPYGDLDADAVARVRETGYDYGCAIWASAYTSRHALPRTYIGEADTAPRLWAKRARHQLAWMPRRAGKSRRTA